MELVLTQLEDYQVTVTCDNHTSHTFDLQPLRLLGHWFDRITDDPVKYGQLLFRALFPEDSPARQALSAGPKRIVLVATNDELDTLPWEYLYGPDGLLVLDIPFVRGLLPEQRIPTPTLDTPLHIVAVPSNPLSPLVEPLNIDAEWSQLIEIINPLPFNITLERVRPPTLQQARRLLANKHQRVLHFMGHGGQVKDGAYLCFEKENGDLDLVGAEQLISRVRDTIFLVTLNACASASPGPTAFSNLASSIVKARVPYALGMRFRIYDDDALAFSRMFYTELAQGVPVEDALLQARRSLAKRPRTWTIGVPVLYTSLATPTSGFVQHDGTCRINEHQPQIEASGITRAVGTFQGRTDDLMRLGSLLTGSKRPRILTIHGGGGQGKTALVREAVERFAYAWSGGVWGTMLDPLPDRTRFVNNLARFLGINVQEIINSEDRERQVLTKIATKRTLLVLDNAETLVDAIEANDSQASFLADFIQQISNTSVTLLVTSRIQLDWPGEITHELGGLTLKEGARLFRQYAPERLEAIDTDEVQELSKKIEGHPLSLHLLAGAFNTSTLSLKEFIQHYEEQLVHAENMYVGEEHRHRKLYASIETSIHYLNDDLRNLLGNLWIFQAPFLASIARYIFDPDTEEIRSPIGSQLNILWQRGLLSRITITALDGTQNLYHLLPTTRLYLKTHIHSTMPQEELFHRYGEAYETFISVTNRALDQSALFVAMMQYMEKDLEQGLRYVAVTRREHYKAYWAQILYHLGKPLEAQTILEDVLEQTQGQDQILELQVTLLLGLVYHTIGQPQQAITLLEQALTLSREVSDHAGEASTLSNLGLVYRTIGQPQQAITLLEQALTLSREVSDHVSEAHILHNMADIYKVIGQPQQALSLYKQALTFSREVGNRSGEATILSDIGLVYRTIGQPQHALSFYEQALPILREVGKRSSEATILYNIADAYKVIGQTQRALSLYEQALTLSREVGNRFDEATILSGMAGIYTATGQPQRALSHLEQALKLSREVGNRSSEVYTLHNMADIYNVIGQPQQALSFFEQALSITREVGNRSSEASALYNIAGIYLTLGQPQQALSLYEQALSIWHEVDDHHNTAITRSSMAVIYLTALGQPQQALSFLEQALPTLREVGDRANEALTLKNIGLVYHTIGQSQQALSFFEQALSIWREVGDRSSEASILYNMAGIYLELGQPQRSLSLYEQALPTLREVGNRSNEASTLSCIGLVYHTIGQSQQALSFFEQALSIWREIGDRFSEAATLNNIAEIYDITGQPQQALSLYEQALPIIQEIGDRSGEGTTTAMIALLYKNLGRQHEALRYIQQARQILEQCDLSHDLVKNTLEEIDILQNTIEQGLPQKTSNAQQVTLFPDKQKQMIINTIAVLTKAPQRHQEWRRRVETFLQDSQTNEPARLTEIDFYNALLAILDGQRPSLPADHPYASALLTIQNGIAQKKTLDTGKEDKASSFKNNSEMLVIIMNNTLAVFSQATHQQKIWRAQLFAMRQTFSQQKGSDDFLALLDTILTLLDRNGDPTGLGNTLTKEYTPIWQALLYHLETIGQQNS